MARIRGRDTGPEMRVRRLAHALGYRFRLHGAIPGRERLPGKPDLVFSARRKVVWVHGCFWHQHPDPACKTARAPKSRPEFWLPKLARNRQRDTAQLTRLQAAGWDVLVLWECQLKDAALLAARLVAFLGPVRWRQAGRTGPSAVEPVGITSSDQAPHDVPTLDDTAHHRRDHGHPADD